MQNYPQMQTPMPAYTIPPRIVYNTAPPATPAPSASPATQQAQTQAALVAPPPMQNIPVQQDVLTLSTKPSYETQNPITPELNAQMPAPNIQNPSAPQTPTQTEEKLLPSLNIGVVDAPNNGVLTPITDDLNARAQERRQKEKPTRLPILKPDTPQNTSIIPQTLGKKSLSAGKLSLYLSFGSLGLILAMLIPKGILKIGKLIKHK